MRSKDPNVYKAEYNETCSRGIPYSKMENLQYVLVSAVRELSADCTTSNRTRNDHANVFALCFL
jgi:hypothetical protein